MKTKQYILGMMAAVGLLLATSCSEDLSIAGISGDMQKVTFSLGLEGQIQTRGGVKNDNDVIVGEGGNGNNIGENDYEGETRISDGTRARHLIFEVYTAEGEPYAFSMANSPTHSNRYEIPDATFPLEITLMLEKNKKYKVVFWADTPENPYYETDDLRNIGIRYDDTDEMNNDELRDAFCYSGELSTVETGDYEEQTITLRRPLAQINVGTTAKDWETIEANYPVDLSKIKINYVGNRFNLVEDKAVISNSTEGMTVADYQYATIPYAQTIIGNETIGAKNVKKDANYLWVNIEQDEDGDGNFKTSETPQKYHWLSMCYILVPSEDNSSTVDITELKFTKEGENYVLEPFANGLANVPVQRNHRTNIIGSILTEEQNFTVTLDANFAGDFNNLYDNGWDGDIANGVAYQSKADDSKYGTKFRPGLNFYVSSAEGLQWLADRSSEMPLEDKDIPGWFSGDLNAYKEFVYKIIDNRTFINGGVTRDRFDKNEPWTYDECTIYLTKDIDWVTEMGDKTFRPFSMKHGVAGGTSVEHSKAFKGEIDGQGHTISNLRIDTRENQNPPSCGALIAATTGTPVLKNLRLEAAYIKASWNVGGFVGRHADKDNGNITMENCQLENSEIYAEVGFSPSNDANIGGLIGACAGGKIENCHVRNTKLESHYIAGGLFGICFSNTTTVKNCSVSDVAIVINEMNADGTNTDKTIENELIDDYWLCGTSEMNITVEDSWHNNVVRSVFYGTRTRTSDKDKNGMGEIDHLPLHWFPQLYGEWANGIMLMSHITGTPSYKPTNGDWCAGLYINTTNTGANTADASYILCGNTQNEKPLYALNVQSPSTPATCYGVYLTGDHTATIKDLVINGDPSITAGIYLDGAKDVVLDNVAVYDVEYTIQDSETQSGATLTVTNCDLRGSTKYGSGYSTVTFTNTTFSTGSGTKDNKANSQMIIPGSATTFKNCVFEQGFKVDNSNNQVTFINCKLMGTDGKTFELTKENIAELVEDHYSVENTL